MTKQIVNVKRDYTYTVLEFNDGSLLPLLNVQAKPEIKTCSFCHRPENMVTLCTLDGQTFICKDCVMKFLEFFVQNGETIELNVDNAMPQVAEQLKNLLKKNSENNLEDKSEDNNE